MVSAGGGGDRYSQDYIQHILFDFSGDHFRFMLPLQLNKTTAQWSKSTLGSPIHSLHLINPPHIPTQSTSHQSPTYTYTAYISIIPHIYLHSLHLINSLHIPTQPTSQCPTYTYTAYISLIPYTYLHSLHLINPPHIPTYTAYISLISYTNLHGLHLMNPLCIPTQPTSH